MPDAGDLPHEVVDELGNVAGFRGNAYKFYAAGLGEQAGPVQVAASNFPGTVTGVIKAPDQFRAASQLYRAKPTHVQYEAVRRAWKGPYVLDKDVVFFSTGAVNKNVWGTIGNHTFCHQYT